MLLTTECVIVEYKDPNAPAPQMPMGGGMGGMM
jgi:chaperonin GroEL